MEPIIIPPIRTCLEDIESVKSAGRADNPPRTEKSWYFYWQRSGEKLAGLVTSGTHANRPASGDMPDGAFYTETDRGNVVYQNVNGVWQYVAGTMWGTLSPDERPTDLGPNDAGFEFRSVDADPAYGGRDFLWSQSEWIEITPIRYGTHATRLAINATTLWSGALFVEIDRGDVIYQNQNGTWHYLAGTMWGTLSPDQRPTDLGVNDAGFDFRATDVAREFLWSQSQWIEVTSAMYGIHSGRPAGSATADGVLYVDSDRGSVIYQLQAGVWHYLAGTMWGTLVPDQRPTDLGANDAGFDFRGTDQQREFIWSGSAWIEVTPSTGDGQIAYASAITTLTTTAQDIGVSLTLNRAGRYFLNGVFDLRGSGTGDAGALLIGQLVADGAVQPKLGFLSVGTAANQASVSQQWFYTASSAGKFVKLQAYKNTGTGTSIASGESTLTALWIGP
jgi:hypothetical protein